MQIHLKTKQSVTVVSATICMCCVAAHWWTADAIADGQDGASAIDAAAALLEQGRVNEACRLLKTTTDQLPTWWVAHYDYVRCAKLLTPNWEELAQHIRAAISTDPDKASLHYELGTIEVELGQLEKAIASFNTALALSPKYREPQRKIADVYWTLGMLSKAREGLEAQFQEAPDDLVAANRLVDVYLHENMLKAAADILEHVARKSRFPAHTMARLAKIYEKIGDTASYRRTMQLLER